MPTLRLRTSERSDFKACRQKWAWAYRDNLVPHGKRPALDFGSLVHLALADFYIPGIKRGQHPAQSFEMYYSEFVRDYGVLYMKLDDGEPSEDAYDLGMEMLTLYVEHYGKDDTYKVIVPEQPISIPVPGPNGRIMFDYKCVCDALVQNRSTKKLGLLEHKTTSSMRKFGAPLELDEQAGSYWTFFPIWLRQQNYLRPNQEMDFIEYNFLRKAHCDPRPTDDLGRSLNKDGSISKKQPLPLFWRETVRRGEGHRRVMLERTINEARDIAAARRGKLAIYKNPGEHCYWCQFRDMCEVHEADSDWEAMRDGLYTVGNPYEQYEVRS